MPKTTEQVSKEWQKHKTEFHVAHSSAIIAWQNVEDGLFFVFCTLCKPCEEEVSSTIFYTANQLAIRLKIIKELVGLRYGNSSAIFENWNNICTKIRKASSNRNDLAHCDAHFCLSSDDKPSLKLDKGKFNIKGNKKNITVKQINDWSSSFAVLAAQVNRFNLLLDEA